MNVNSLSQRVAQAESPLFSFVIPAYNEELYLGACLESILAQTRRAGVTAEILVVNNASTDRTRAVALAYPGVTVIDEPRKGITFARQAGFSASRGRLIANVDADAQLTEGWLERVRLAFARDPKLIALSGPLAYTGLSAFENAQVQVFYLLALGSYVVNRWVLRVGSMMQGGNFIVRREALEAIGGFDTGIAFYGEDTDIARRLHAAGKTRFTTRLRMHSSSRRLRHEGMFTMAARYSLNYFWTTFFKRPYTGTYIDVREQTPCGSCEAGLTD